MNVRPVGIHCWQCGVVSFVRSLLTSQEGGSSDANHLGDTRASAGLLMEEEAVAEAIRHGVCVPMDFPSKSQGLWL